MSLKSDQLELGFSIVVFRHGCIGSLDEDNLRIELFISTIKSKRGDTFDNGEVSFRVVGVILNIEDFILYFFSTGLSLYLHRKVNTPNIWLSSIIMSMHMV